jgi:hypothetical protein
LTSCCISVAHRNGNIRTGFAELLSIEKVNLEISGMKHSAAIFAPLF